MSKKERIASSLDRITDLCFTISELAIGENSEEEATAGASTSGLSPEAAVFEPSRKGKEEVLEEDEECFDREWDWESVPDLPSESDVPPSYSQVAGSTSQAVWVTPLCQSIRELSVDSGGSSAMAAAHPNFAGMTVQQFDQYYNGLQNDPARVACETQALAQGGDPIRISVLLKRDNRNHANLTAMQGQLQQAQNTAQQAQQAAAAAAAAQAAAVAAAAGQVKASPPSKWENKASNPPIREWFEQIEDYLRNAPNAEYLRLACSYLNGKPRSYWSSQYAVYQRANPGVYPANARQFFRDTMTRGYGLRTPEQSYWDTWNNLKQGSMSVDEYNVAFEQAATNLAAEITDEQVKIEKYRSGLQVDLKELCRTSPNGNRWNTLAQLAQFATLQWPTVEERLKRKPAQSTKSVAGKRKSAGGGAGKTSKARLSAALTDEQYAHNMANRLCHNCGKPNHIAADCPEESQDGSKNGGKQKKSRKDFQKR